LPRKNDPRTAYFAGWVNPVGGPSIAIPPLPTNGVLPLTWLAASEARDAHDFVSAVTEGIAKLAAGL
jgi:hypothetical protein